MADIDELQALAKRIQDKLTSATATLTGINTDTAQLVSGLQELEDEGGVGDVEMVVDVLTHDTITVRWIIHSEDRFTSWEIGRDGFDSSGHGPWKTMLPGTARSQQFNLLVPNTVYTITLLPMSNVDEQPISLQVKTKVAPTPPTGGTVAEMLGWGPVIFRDEFDYTGDPDPKKWMPCGVKGTGWSGHAGNGRRMPECSTVKDGMLVMTGKDNGHTGWLRALNYARYGRVEFCSRSRNTGSSGATYHPLGLWWPTDPEDWPENGELDVVEYTDPNAKQASAWLHYPHPEYQPNGSKTPIQQAGPFSVDCDMTQWNTFNVEWDSTGVRSWLNGKKWYDVRDGAGPYGRKNIQDMTKGMWTFQLDNFSKNGPWRAAVFEIQYIRFYAVP